MHVLQKPQCLKQCGSGPGRNMQRDRRMEPPSEPALAGTHLPWRPTSEQGWRTHPNMVSRQKADLLSHKELLKSQHEIEQQRRRNGQHLTRQTASPRVCENARLVAVRSRWEHAGDATSPPQVGKCHVRSCPGAGPGPISVEDDLATSSKNAHMPVP